MQLSEHIGFTRPDAHYHLAIFFYVSQLCTTPLGIYKWYQARTIVPMTIKQINEIDTGAQPPIALDRNKLEIYLGVTFYFMPPTQLLSRHNLRRSGDF